VAQAGFFGTLITKGRQLYQLAIILNFGRRQILKPLADLWPSLGFLGFLCAGVVQPNRIG
jgi:hypothetical protein